jgi:hypothetical protein
LTERKALLGTPKLRVEQLTLPAAGNCDAHSRQKVHGNLAGVRRERWFRVVMGQDEVARLITPDQEMIPLPAEVAERLSFELAIA